MRDKLELTRSSWLVCLPAIGVCLLLCAIAAFFGQIPLAAALLFLALMALGARLWAFASAKRISIRVSSKLRGLFPGEEAGFDIEVRNDKFLPVVWLDLFCPLARNLCMVPEDCRKPDEWEMIGLEDEGASVELVGEKRFSSFLWYEMVRFTSHWTAQRRGVYSMEGWRLRTGDGFGLTQVERPILREDVCRFAVYPKLIPVSPELFLRSLWNADTGTRGVMEDPTIIRSTRDYMTSDSFKQINWRLSARGLPLTVNVYEDIMPKNVHFLFDGESFSGPPQHLEEMEEALSILASELVRLNQAQVRCGLSLCQGRGLPAHNQFGAESPFPLLQVLAAYEPMELKWDGESNSYVPQSPIFDSAPIYEAVRRVGRFYYIVYDTGCLSDRSLLRKLDHTRVTILTYADCPPYGEYETICLNRLKEGKNHG